MWSDQCLHRPAWPQLERCDGEKSSQRSNMLCRDKWAITVNMNALRFSAQPQCQITKMCNQPTFTFFIKSSNTLFKYCTEFIQTCSIQTACSNYSELVVMWFIPTDIKQGLAGTLLILILYHLNKKKTTYNQKYFSNCNTSKTP